MVRIRRVGAVNRYNVVVDNVSHIPSWLSDAYCRLATGGGFATRELYTDDGEKIIAAMRPIILNGIEDFIVRGDLADRAVTVSTQPISDEDRLAQGEMKDIFKKEHAAVLGFLLDSVANGLKNLPATKTKLKEKPRMADAAIWITACEEGMGVPMTFLNAFRANREALNETLLSNDTIASAIRKLVGEKGRWIGEATELHRELGYLVDDEVRRSKNWPKAPNALSGRVRRVAPTLRTQGYEIVNHDKTRTEPKRIEITGPGYQPGLDLKPVPNKTKIEGAYDESVPPVGDVDDEEIPF
jgi:hypothetical protein